MIRNQLCWIKQHNLSRHRILYSEVLQNTNLGIIVYHTRKDAYKKYGVANHQDQKNLFKGNFAILFTVPIIQFAVQFIYYICEWNAAHKGDSQNSCNPSTMQIGIFVTKESDPHK